MKDRFLVSALLCLAWLVSGFAGSGYAQEDDARSKVEAELQQRINEAISRGVDALLRQQEIDGSWKEQAAGYPNGQTSLCLYALVKCDTAADHPAVRRAVDFLRLQAPVKTYSAALQLMALCALDAQEHREWIAEIADSLESWQNGGYGYPDAEPDLSNTQYAVLGLRAAAKNGYKVNKKTWERVARWTLDLQQQGKLGGFRYRKDYDVATGSMTSAGIAVLAICREQNSRAGKSVDEGLEYAQEWLAKHFQIKPAPYRNFADDGPAKTDGGESYYYVYGLERVGGLMGTSHFGEHDWYREGALWLLDKQDGAGRWGNQSDTCFALLFLTRATARETYTGAGIRGNTYTYGQDSSSDAVSLRAAGRGPITAWISSFGKYIPGADSSSWIALSTASSTRARRKARCS